MAEIALILGGLSAAYIASNRNTGQDKSKEGYRNPNFDRSKYLPNTNIPTTNYPVIQPNTGSNVNDYKNANAATDRYYARGVDFDKMSAGANFSDESRPNSGVTNSHFDFFDQHVGQFATGQLLHDLRVAELAIPTATHHHIDSDSLGEP